MGCFPPTALSGVVGVDGFLTQHGGQLLESGRLLTAQKDGSIHVSDNGICVILINRLELTLRLQHQTGGDLTASDGGHQLFQLGYLANVGALVDQTAHMNRQSAVVHIVGLFAEQVKQLGITHGYKEIKAVISVTHDEEQGSFPVSQSIQLQLIISRDLTQLCNVEHGKARTAGNQNGFCGFAQNDTVYLYSDSSSNLTVSNYNDQISFLAGNFNSSICTFIGEEYVYNELLCGYYYIGINLADYQNYVSTTEIPTPTETSAPATTDSVPVETPNVKSATKLIQNQELIISGKTDFNYFYTYKDVLNYKCFSLTKDGKRFYASVREDLYDYYKNAFQNHSLTLKGTYKFTAEDGSPVVSVSTLVEGTKETNLRSYLWTVNKGSIKNPNFKAYADLKGDGLVLSAAEDGKSITIDSNPWGAAKGSQAYKLDNDFALLMISERSFRLCDS